MIKVLVFHFLDQPASGWMHEYFTMQLWIAQQIWPPIMVASTIYGAPQDRLMSLLHMTLHIACTPNHVVQEARDSSTL